MNIYGFKRLINAQIESTILNVNGIAAARGNPII